MAVVQSRHGSPGSCRRRPPDRCRDAARDEGGRHQGATPSTRSGRSRSCSSATPRPDARDPETGEKYDDVIVIWVADEDDKQALVLDEDSPYFTTPHFDGHPSVLLRASRIGEIDLDELTELVQDAWLSQASRRRGETWLASGDQRPLAEPRCLAFDATTQEVPMKCPNDGATLTMSERSGVEIDYCPECRGVWLDRGELDKILDRVGRRDARRAPAGRAPQPAATEQDYRSRIPATTSSPAAATRRQYQATRATARSARSTGSPSSSTELELGVRPAARARVEADRRGGGEVEALGAAEDRDRHPVVGQRREVVGQAPGLVAEQPGDRLLEQPGALGLEQVGLPRSVGGEHDEAGRLRASYGLGRVVGQRDGQVPQAADASRGRSCRCRGRRCCRPAPPRPPPRRRRCGSPCRRCRGRGRRRR